MSGEKTVEAVLLSISTRIDEVFSKHTGFVEEKQDEIDRITTIVTQIDEKITKHLEEKN